MEYLAGAQGAKHTFSEVDANNSAAQEAAAKAAAVRQTVGRILGNRRPAILDGFALLRAAGVALPRDAHRADVSGRGLVDAAVDDMAHFSRLAILDASDNALPLSCVASLPALVSVRLACNSLAGIKIPPGALSWLERLDLSHNVLRPKAIAPLALLPRLRDLDLSGNGLEDVRFLASPPPFVALERLRLSGNCLSGAGPLARLATLPLLRILHLDHNYIDAVPPPPREQRLARSLHATLTSGSAGSADTAAVTGGEAWFPALAEVDLSHNYVGHAAAAARLLGAPRLRRILLTGNPVAVAPAALQAARRRLAGAEEARGSATAAPSMQALQPGGEAAAASSAAAVWMGAQPGAVAGALLRRKRGLQAQGGGSAGSGAAARASGGGDAGLYAGRKAERRERRDGRRVSGRGVDAAAAAAAARMLGGVAMARALAGAVLQARGAAESDSESDSETEADAAATLGPAERLPGSRPGRDEVASLRKTEVAALASLEPAVLLKVRIMREAAARGLVEGAGSAEWKDVDGRAPRDVEIVTAGPASDPALLGADRGGAAGLSATGPMGRRGGRSVGSAGAAKGRRARGGPLRGVVAGGTVPARLWTVRDDALPLGREWREAGNRLLFDYSDSEDGDREADPASQSPGEEKADLLESDALAGEAEVLEGGGRGGEDWDDGGGARRVGALPDWARGIVSRPRPRRQRLQQPGGRHVPAPGRGRDSAGWGAGSSAPDDARLRALARLGERGVRRGGVFVREEAAAGAAPAGPGGTAPAGVRVGGAVVLRSAGASLASAALAGGFAGEDAHSGPESRGDGGGSWRDGPPEDPFADWADEWRPFPAGLAPSDSVGSLARRAEPLSAAQAAEAAARGLAGSAGRDSAASLAGSVLGDRAAGGAALPSVRAAAKMLRSVLRQPAVLGAGRAVSGLKPPAYLRVTATGRARVAEAAARRRRLGNARDEGPAPQGRSAARERRAPATPVRVWAAQEHSDGFSAPGEARGPGADLLGLRGAAGREAARAERAFELAAQTRGVGLL